MGFNLLLFWLKVIHANVYTTLADMYFAERDLSATKAVEPGTGTIIDGVPFFKSPQSCPFWGPRPSEGKIV